MAKWGEGDPRWIVEERPDATNVNNWHWTERNASSWSQGRLKSLFEDFVIISDKGDIKIVEIEKCEGDASANNRKGKLIFFYEWNLLLKWKGRLNGDDHVFHEGKICIPNLSEENDISEVDITVSAKDNDEESEDLKKIIYLTGKDQIREQLTKYVSGLKEEFSKGMILPKKDKNVKPDSVTNLSSGFNKKVNLEVCPKSVVNNDTQQLGIKIDTTSLSLTQKFQCTAQDFYEVMTRVEMVRAFTQSQVKLDVCKGGKFALFGDNIVGTFEELIPGKKIVQKWRFQQWPAGHMSLVTIDIEEKGDHTEVRVTQTGVPSAEATRTQQNWERYYWDAIKRVFGFGAFFT